MTVRKIFSEGWRRLRAALVPDQQRPLLEVLRRQYVEDTCNVVQLIRHARRMHYPQFRERLLQLAREDLARAEWLRGQIVALGGDLPAVACPPMVGKNSWECLRIALEAEKRSCATLLECIHQADRADPALAAELRRWRARAKQHCDEITNMLMKSDPYALPPPLPPGHEPQEWLARQKRVWLEQERARWEAGREPVPWGEWVEWRECQWLTELLRRELEGNLRQNGNEPEEVRTATEGIPVHPEEPDKRRIHASALPA